MKAQEALRWLLAGNERYLGAKLNPGDVSLSIRKETKEKGQSPKAVVVCCSDSRVIPEAIFQCGIGEIFTIRVAGNVASEDVIASCEYAVAHLGVPLVMVMGHSCCGAVGAALEGHGEKALRCLVHPIQKAIGEEKDPRRASQQNAREQARIIAEAIPHATTIAAFYDIETGKVEVLE